MLIFLLQERRRKHHKIIVLVLDLRIRRRRWDYVHVCADELLFLNRERRQIQIFDKVVLLPIKRRRLQFLPGAGDIYTCADDLFLPHERRLTH